MLPRGRYDTETRKGQINTLKQFNAVTELQEDVEYQVDFVAGGNHMAILVTLTPEFPSEKPILNIRPKVIHPWVNEQSEIISAPGLLNYSVHSDLGRIVSAVIGDFKRNPPPLASEVGSHMKTLPPTVNGVVSPTYGLASAYDPAHSNYLDNRINTPQHQLLRTQSVAFPELSKLTIEELNRLNESDDRQANFLDEFPLTKKTNKALDDLITQNEELAKHNLSKQPQLEKLKRLVAEKKKRLQVQKGSYERASQLYKTLSDKYSPENIKDSLRLAARKCDEESEEIAEKFLNKELNVDTFLERYIERRMLSHTRKTKEEKLSSQLKELHKAGY